MSDAERNLWYRLRRKQLDGHRFRRQVPLGGYIVDFACLGARLVIELDGGQHNEEENEAQDALRTRCLQTMGYRVLRFWNSDVLTELDSVMETIFNELSLRHYPNSTSPHPDPPPAGEGKAESELHLPPP
jgi:very-short-patch-repair endonuclease